MNIPITGFIIILMTFFFLFFNYKKLHNMLIFFMPFSATAILNIGSDGNGSAVQPYMFIGAILLGISFFNPKVHIFSSLDKDEKMILFFVLIAFISLVMPLFINGTETINVSGQLGGKKTVLTLTNRHFTQFLYLLLGVLLSVYISHSCGSLDKWFKTIQIFSFSILFVIFWGFFEFFCKKTGLPYPNDIFNNSASASAKGYLGIVELSGMGKQSELSRISSVGTEPSIIVQTVLILLPFYLINQKRIILSKIIDRIMPILMILFLLLSGSSISIISLFFLLWLIFTLKSKKIGRTMFISTVVIILLVIIFYILIIFFEDTINALIINKLDSYSGQERLSTIADSWGYFLKYPLLGIGWSSITSFDLFVKLLSNVGIIGAGIFILFIYNIISVLYAYKNYDPSILSILVSLLVFLFANAISSFSFVFGHTWFIFGISMGMIRSIRHLLANKKKL